MPRPRKPTTKVQKKPRKSPISDTILEHHYFPAQKIQKILQEQGIRTSLRAIRTRRKQLESQGKVPNLASFTKIDPKTGIPHFKKDRHTRQKHYSAPRLFTGRDYSSIDVSSGEPTTATNRIRKNILRTNKGNTQIAKELNTNPAWVAWIRYRLRQDGFNPLKIKQESRGGLISNLIRYRPDLTDREILAAVKEKRPNATLRTIQNIKSYLKIRGQVPSEKSFTRIDVNMGKPIKLQKKGSNSKKFH